MVGGLIGVVVVEDEEGVGFEVCEWFGVLSIGGGLFC